MKKKVYKNIKTDRSVSLRDLTPVNLQNPDYWTTGQIEYVVDSTYEYEGFLYKAVQLDYSQEGNDIPLNINSVDYWIKTNKIYDIGAFYSYNDIPKFCIRKDYSISLDNLIPFKIENPLYWNSKVAEVRITTTPADATCLINNIEAKVLKVSVPSTASIKILKEGYDTIEDTIEITEEKTYIKNYLINEVEATIMITTEPNNAITKINGETTRIKKVGYGYTTVSVELEGYISILEKYFINKSGNYDYHYNLVKKPDPKCTIMVISDPEDALVLIDGEATTILETQLGKHIIEVSKEGYETQIKEIYIDNETTVMLSFILIKESEKKALIYISITPENAFITIDGKPYDRETQYSVGQRNITATAYGYKTYSTIVNLDEEKIYNFDINLAIIEAKVSFTTEPEEAQIILQSKVVDKEVYIPFGYNTVQAELSGYYTITDNIDIVNEEPLSKYYILKRRDVKYQFNISVDDVIVYINDKVSNSVGVLKSGIYQVSINKIGYHSVNFTMELIQEDFIKDIELIQIVAPIHFIFNLRPYRLTINDYEIIMPEKEFVHNLTYGEYHITAVAPTTKLVETSLSVKTDEPQTVNIEFERIIGTVKFTFNNEVNGFIYIDDLVIEIKQGTASIQLYEGDYSYNIEVEGYDSVQGELHIRETKEYLIDIILTAVSSDLILTIYPTDSVLKINERVYQYVNGMFGTKLPYGTFNVNVSREGYETYQEVIENTHSTTFTRDIYLGEL